jgi:hypothetical protein
MSEKKMIIRNCPAYSDYCEEIKSYECQDCTDCVMKQIVEKCKRTLSINKVSENEFTLGKMTFAEFILKDIDIQEVE